jgi:hypothetical protein
MELRTQITNEERIYADDGTPVLALHTLPIIVTLEQRKKIELEGHELVFTTSSSSTKAKRPK